MVIGTYNRKDALRQCLAETHRSFGNVPHEIIVVDGGSTDGTLEWLALQPDILTVKQGRLVGATRAFNAGFRLARGEIVGHINDDDMPLDSCLREGTEYLMAHPEAGQVCFAFDGWKDRQYKIDTCFGIPYCNKGLTRRHLGDRAGWWDEMFHTYASDTELSMRIHEMGHKIVRMDGCRVHDLRTRDELSAINNEKRRGSSDRNAPHPDSTLFYKKRKGLRPASRKTSILHLALNTRQDKQPALTRALKSMGDYYLSLDWQANRRTLEQALQEHLELAQPDLIFMQIQTKDILTDKMLSMMLDSNAIIVNWSGDVRAPMPQWYTDVGKRIHLTLFTNDEWVEKLRDAGCNADYLQIGFNQEIYHPWGKAAEDTPPIVMLANHYGNKFPLSQLRLDVAEHLTKRYGEQFGLYGAGWPFKCRKRLNHEQEAAVYRGAKVAIGISQFDLPRYTSDRLFRAMGSGCAYFTRSYPGLEKDFDPGIPLAEWHNIEELGALIRAYLKDHEGRERMARVGAELVHHDHAWLDRAQQLRHMIGWEEPWEK